jgi:tetratricopeptide (TPR) repeat protein
MSRRRSGRSVVLAAATVLLACLAFELGDRLLYLPRAEALRLISFGFDSLLADLIYLWSIQYYSETDNPLRFEKIEHIFNVITDLDPHYLDVYSIGALIMTFDYHDPDLALKLLDRGIARNPQQWILPLDAGLYARMNRNDHALAARYFARAMTIPNAPKISPRLYAGSLEQAGDKRAALEMWRSIFHDADDDHVRAISRRRAEQLEVELELETLRAALSRYRADHGRLPGRLEALAPDYVAALPLDPQGQPYLYDPRSGEVSRAGGFQVARG